MKRLFLILIVIFALNSCEEDGTPNNNNVKKTYNITFNSDGGNNITSQEVIEGQRVIRPNNPIKTGHVFLDWYLGLIPYDFNKGVTTDLVLKAKWDVESYNVSFNSDGGTVVNAQTVIYGEKLIVPDSPTKTDFIFLGWYKNGELFNFETPVTSDFILIAKWLSIWETIDIDGGVAIIRYNGSDTKIIVPSTVDGKNVLEIIGSYNATSSEGIFGQGGLPGFNANTTIESIDMSQAIYLEKIEGSNAFGACVALTSVKFNNGLKEIGNLAFRYCTAITEIDISQTQVSSIGGMAFSSMESLTNVKFSNSLKFIGPAAFFISAKLESLDFSNTLLETIDGEAFARSPLLRSIILGNKMELIKAGAFQDCTSLNSLTINETEHSIHLNRDGTYLHPFGNTPLMNGTDGAKIYYYKFGYPTLLFWSDLKAEWIRMD